MHRIPNDPGNQGSGWLFWIKTLLGGCPAPPPWACFQGQDFLGTRAEWPDGLHPRAQPSTPSRGARCTQPGLAPQGAPQCLPAEGISTSCRHSTDPGLPVPADFPWREEHDLVREQGPGQQVATEQPCPALPCSPALQPCPGSRPVMPCGWVSAARGPGGGATPPPQIPPRPEPLQAMLLRQAFRAPSVLESLRPPPEHSASSGPC